MKTIIITSTVHVNSGLTKLLDQEERLKQYLKSILFFISAKYVEQIVICDNSDFDYSRYDDFFTSITKKKIEYLRFNGNKDCIYRQGKGYGEGEIMEFTLNKSQLLLNAGNSFLKVTGRLEVSNIDQILKVSNAENDCFQLAGSNPFKDLEAIDTRFYQCTIPTFKKYFINEYKNVNDDKGMFLEHCYYNAFKKNNIKLKMFNVLPIISGISGSTGLSYSERKFKLFLMKILFYTKRVFKSYL